MYDDGASPLTDPAAASAEGDDVTEEAVFAAFLRDLVNQRGSAAVLDKVGDVVCIRQSLLLIGILDSRFCGHSAELL